MEPVEASTHLFSGDVQGSHCFGFNVLAYKLLPIRNSVALVLRDVSSLFSFHHSRSRLNLNLPNLQNIIYYNKRRCLWRSASLQADTALLAFSCAPPT